MRQHNFSNVRHTNTHVKIPRKSHNHEAQLSRGTKIRTGEEQMITKQTPIYERSVGKLLGFLTLLLLNTSCPALANSIEPDQLASEEAN